jgi:acetyl-CoA synthetase
MAIAEQLEVSEAQIAVHWREEEYLQPPPRFVGQANAHDPAILERFAEENFPRVLPEYADLLSWDQYWHTTLDTSNAPFWKWFVGGRLNASYNCVDRHLETTANKAAIIFVPEPEEELTRSRSPTRSCTVRVNEFAALLRDFCGLKTGDRITIHMPMVAELPVTMLACARLGIVHSEVFGGFSGAACGDRIADSGSRVLITMDGYYRNGELVDHKVKADEADRAASRRARRSTRCWSGGAMPASTRPRRPMVEGRDFFVDEIIGEYERAVVGRPRCRCRPRRRCS